MINVREYLQKKEQYYGLPENMDSMGRVVDRKTNNELIIGVSVYRDLYDKTGYLCNEEAPEELHVCACSLLDHVQKMAIIKTVLLTPKEIYESICGEAEPSEELIYYSNMALCALRESLKGVLYEQEA